MMYKLTPLLILFVLQVVKGEFRGQINPEVAVSQLLNRLFDNDISECVLLVSIDVNWLKESTEDIQQVQIDLDPAFHSAQVIKLLDTEAKCLVSIAGFEEASAILSITKPISNHVIIYVDEATPDKKLLLGISRPLVLVKQGHIKDFFQYVAYCPKVGQPKIIKPQSVGSCSKRCCNKSCLPAKVTKVCSNPFRGQVVTMAEPVTFPNFLLPQMGFNIGHRAISGGIYNAFATAGQYFGFRPRFKFNIAGGNYVPENNTFSPGKFFSVINGDTEVTSGSILPIYASMFDFTSPYIFANLVYVTRSRQQVTSYSHIVKPFTLNVWLTAVFTVLLLATMQLFVYQMYQRPLYQKYNLTKAQQPWFDFYLFSICKITEPEYLPWFPKWSAGKFLTALWIVLSLFLVLFYNSHLRAHFMTTKYEEPPSTLNHIVQRQERVYIVDIAVGLRKEYLEATGQAGSVKHKIAVLAEKLDGIYSLTGRGLPEGAPEDLASNGAFILMEDLTIPYVYIPYPTLGMESIYIVDEPTNTFYKTLMVKRHSPATEPLSDLSARMIDAGLIRRWFHEHLSMRSTLKPKPEKIKLKALSLTSYYLSGMIYTAAVVIASSVFLAEKIIK